MASLPLAAVATLYPSSSRDRDRLCKTRVSSSTNSRFALLMFHKIEYVEGFVSVAECVDTVGCPGYIF